MTWGPALVYGLCLLTSVICAVLLVRSYRQTRSRLLLWTALCFMLLAVNNLLVVFDMLVWREMDLTYARQLTALAGVSVLIYGFIWEARK